MKFALLMSLLLALPAAASQQGAWSATSAGGSVSIGKQVLRSRPLHAPDAIPSSANITRIAWRITLLTPPPSGLQVKLCRIDKCLLLPALAGTLSVKIPLAAKGEFRFIYSINRAGQLQSPLNVLRNQLTVNYR
ncbi:flagellar protein FlhE [Kosakonia sp. SMBL-WEM22]|uniref:flagellar protein FlhE n=1 Tax=Kosakonia sp. SMBL-WEM22 TaxID=2725560 RepID=UPI001659A5AC|nr:flagellar protein FlhE [Kosakonia sp. SMBL-WEM22]QNQ21563.1 flagellar protein FlhE [Kosakonia sp. SMBL-WEM22]